MAYFLVRSIASPPLGLACASSVLSQDAFPNSPITLVMPHLAEGGARALIELTAGRVSMIFAYMSEVPPFLDEAQLRAVDITAHKRSPLAPRTPKLSWKWDAIIRDAGISNEGTSFMSPEQAAHLYSYERRLKREDVLSIPWGSL